MIHTILKPLLWLCIRLLISTYRIEVRGLENREGARRVHPKGSYIFAVWHEQVLSVMSGLAWTQPYLALASRSKDGDYAAYVASKLGFIPVRGSSRKRNVDKGGKEAIKEYIQKLAQGISGGITVDGPKGPRQVCKPGVAIISQESGAPIVPVTAVATSVWEFNSWDRFKLPKPFSKIVMIFGEPILVEKSTDPEVVTQATVTVTHALMALEKNLRS